MRKKLIGSLIGSFALALLLCAPAFAQVPTPAASPMASVQQVIGLSKATISYGRPSLRGRQMLGSASIPFGKVWRTGADQVSTLNLTQDMLLDGKPVPKGKYALFTIPGADEWTVIVNKNPNQWGAFGYQQADDLLRFTVKPEKLKQPVETLIITFEDIQPSTASVVLRWEKTQIKFGIAHDADEQIMADIKAKTAKLDSANAQTLYDAANYYFNKNRDLPQALVWANRLVELQPMYWTYFVKAKIAAKLGQCDVAATAAEKGLEMAKKEGDDAYMVNLGNVLKSCGKEPKPAKS